MTRPASFITRPFVVTCLTNFIGSFQIGYNIGAPVNIQNAVKDFMNTTLSEREGSVPSEVRVTNLWAITVAIYYLGAVPGCLGSQWLIEKCSRKRVCLYNVFVGCLSAVFFIASRRSAIWEFLLIGRFLIGAHCGIHGTLVPVYLSEISPKEIRGAVAGMNPVCIAVGILTPQILGFPLVLGTTGLWDVVLGMALVPCLLQLLILPFAMESPRFLMMANADRTKARQALSKLRQSVAIDEEVRELQAEMANVGQKVSLIGLFQYPPYRRATVLVVIAHVSLQLSGLNGVFVYANNLFQEAASLSQAQSAYAASAIGVLAIITSVVNVSLSDVTGRRSLLLLSFLGMTLCLLAATIGLVFKNSLPGIGIAVIVLLVLSVGFFNLGIGTVPWIMVGEYFTPETKPMATALSVGSNYAFGCLLTYAFPLLLTVLKDYIFLPFCIYLTFMFVLFYFQMPETKGKTFEEISALFERPGDDQRRHDRKSRSRSIASHAEERNPFQQ